MLNLAVSEVKKILLGSPSVPGRGAGVATKLQLCWPNTQARARVFDPANDFLLFATGTIFSSGSGTGGSGIGTGALASGTITFEDYNARKTAAIRGSCPSCDCGCDCSTLCVQLPAALEQSTCTDLAGEHLVTGDCHTVGLGSEGSDCVNDDKRIICKWTKTFGDPFGVSWLLRGYCTRTTTAYGR